MMVREVYANHHCSLDPENPPQRRGKVRLAKHQPVVPLERFWDLEMNPDFKMSHNLRQNPKLKISPPITLSPPVLFHSPHPAGHMLKKAEFLPRSLVHVFLGLLHLLRDPDWVLGPLPQSHSDTHTSSRCRCRMRFSWRHTRRLPFWVD